MAIEHSGVEQDESGRHGLTIKGRFFPFSGTRAQTSSNEPDEGPTLAQQLMDHLGMPRRKRETPGGETDGSA